MIDEVSQRKIKGLIAGRKRQADAAGDQLANVNKAYLGVTGKPKLGTIHPKTAGTVGKATQGDDRLIDAGNVFRKQEMIARRKQWDAEWRLKGNKGKDPRNEEVTTNEYLEDFQTPEREKETAREMQRAQGNARRKAKAWRPNTSKSYNQEAEFDRAVDKLTSKVSQVEKERRSGKVFGLGGKTVAKPGTRTMSKIKGQRTAQQAADRDDREGKYMGVGEFSRSSEKATDLIAAAKKAKGRKEAVEVDGDSIEEVTTEAKMIKYPADLEHKNHRDMTPAEKQRWIAYNRAYTQAVSSRDFSGIETSPSLGTKSKEYQDAWKAWNKQKTKHAANRDFHLIKPFVAPK